MAIKFSELNLNPILLSALDAMGYSEATSVQEQVLPHAFEGKDLMVSSQTGSGKTAAFLLPILNHLLSESLDEKREGASSNKRSGNGRGKGKAVVKPKALILCPTRELAQQVSKEAIRLKGNARGIRISTVVGGMPYGQQIRELENVTLLVATPGRLIDLYSQKIVSLSEVEFFVADEADRMLDLGFADDLKALREACTNCKQNLMFSATFPKNIMKLAEAMMKEPVKIELASEEMVNVNIAQQINWADDQKHQIQLLMHWLDSKDINQAVVFTSTQIESESIAEMLEDKGLSVTYLHGGIPQKVRNRRLDLLRRGRVKFLVATDVAARGIDVASISHVINIGLPMKPEDYVHRIGRTGRAGRTGCAVSIVNMRDHKRLTAINQYTSHKVDISEVEGLEPTLSIDKFREAKRKSGGRNDSRNRNGKKRTSNYSKSKPRAQGDHEHAPRQNRDRNKSRERSFAKPA